MPRIAFEIGFQLSIVTENQLELSGMKEQPFVCAHRFCGLGVQTEHVGMVYIHSMIPGTSIGKNIGGKGEGVTYMSRNWNPLQASMLMFWHLGHADSTAGLG